MGKKTLFEFFNYCNRCCMPETNEDMQFDEMGICLACQSAEQKIHIDWKKREKQLKKIFEKTKKDSKDNYDCVIGISGGKDSTFQLYVLTKVYGLNPLAVTFNHTWYNETGLSNLQNSLEKFNVDNLMFTPRKDTVKKLAKKSLTSIGDSCWHCHAGIGAFVLQTAIRYNVPLIVWGESASHASGKGSTHETPVKYDRNYFIKQSAKVEAIKMKGDGITMKQMNPYVFPSEEECNKSGIKGIFLSDYIFWDDERQEEFVRDEYGWKEHPVEHTYKNYKSSGCDLNAVHDYSKFVKRGFGRATDQASQDVRAGLLTRDEAFKLIKKYDTKKPVEALKLYLEITGYSEKEFFTILENQREGKAKKLPNY
jgi:N-acetyl sugar amidotransferase